MKAFFSFVLLFFLTGVRYVPAQSCPAGTTKITVHIIPDAYIGETSWDLKNQYGNIILNGSSNSDSICVPFNTCYTFTIYDAGSDGICCNNGIGSYALYSGSVLVASGGQFGSQQSAEINCGPGEGCSNAITVLTGNYTAPSPNTWYLFNPSSKGLYSFSTCDTSNCNTSIWIYDHCGGVVNNTNAGTIYYNDDNGNCGNKGVITAALDTMHTYYIRIGGDSSCTGDSIAWSLNYLGPITGCLDASACNYNPLATISDSSCLYYPNILCGQPDLEIDSAEFQSSLSLSFPFADNCAVQEACLNGYGTRTVIAFTTHVKNTGTADYFIGDPQQNPAQFTFDNCHGHAHYEGYVEYVMYDSLGNPMPSGFKNGFCVTDFECNGGGTAKFGCNQMGITMGCGDIYYGGLPCQWIDITDIKPGKYILETLVNWNHKPDALGRYELTYANNRAQVCINITSDSSGNKSFYAGNNCSAHVDCAGTVNGNALKDCNGNCNGAAKMGDLDNNGQQEINDAQQYVSAILNNSITPASCNDLSSDNKISVWDAVLLENCVNHGTSTNIACVFPRGIVNPYQTTKLKIDTLNLSQGYIDVSMLSPLTDVTAYEFELHGIQILNVISLVNASDYPGNPQYIPGGNKVIGISYADSSITRYQNYRKLCRIYYSSLTDTLICIEKIIDVINNRHEATQKTIDGPCWMSDGSIGIKNIDPKNYFIIYPNPTDNYLNITTNFDGGKGNLFISDIMGRTVFNRSVYFNEKSIVIDVSALQEGVYTISIQTEKNCLSKRIVLNK